MTTGAEGRRPARTSALLEAVDWLERRLAGCDEPRAVAEWAVAEAAGIGRAALRAGLGGPLSQPAAARLEAMAERLAGGEPLAYVVGWAPFHGLRIAVDRRVLIPRPETEGLVELALEDLPTDRPVSVLDVGTGSGCIAAAVAWARPAAAVRATDTSPDALEVAGANLRRLGLSDRIWLERGSLTGTAAPESADLVMSNPPYVASHEWGWLATSVRGWEPREALDGGPDGLSVIRDLIPAALSVLRQGGAVWMEIGEGHGAEVARLLAAAGFADVRIERDVTGRDRYAAGRRP